MTTILMWLMLIIGFISGWWMNERWERISQWGSVRWLNKMRLRYFSSDEQARE